MATEDLEWERSKISNQDMNLLKRLGFTKKKDALRFPHEESYPSPPMEYRVSFVDHLIRGLSPPIHEFLRGLLFVYGLQLHQLTPNSILHVSIFITLCECFLGVQPNWALWKRIFCLRRNGSHGVAYNIGGVVICVRSDVDYFDVKFPDSVQGWRKRWLYVHEESSDSMEYNIAPFDGKTKILRRRSWDAEATEEEKLATEALMTRIRELQSTRGKELSGIQITAYFLRIRVQPLQARKNPLWMYAGDEDVERLSTDLSAKDLEKLIRRISKLSKKDTVPSSCKVKPFCSANPLPEGHLVLSSLPPLPEGGEVEERAVVTDDNQGASRPESGVGGSQKSAASLEKENETEVTSSTRSSLPAASPKGKRKRDETIDSGASKADTSRAEKTAPNAGEKTLDLYDAALISSDDEEENAPIDETARTSTSRTLVVSEARPDGDETSPPQQNPEHPTPAELIRFGTQFIGYRDYAGKLEEKLAEANRRADALATELEQSETARMKAEAKAATVEDLQKRLDDAKRALEENVAQHSAREEEILGRLESQSRRFVRRTHQEYELENPEDDELLDALSLLEIHGCTQQAQDAIAEKDSAVAEAAAATSRENFMLQLLTDASLDMAGSFLDAATEDERVGARSNALLRLAHDHGSNFWGTPERTRQIVRFQDRALQVRDYLDFCTRTLSLVYGTMSPHNKMPETLPALMDKFRDAPRIHGFVRAQLAAGARFAMIMIKICYPKLDVGQVVPKCLAKMAKRKKNFSKYDDVVTPVAEDMMDELLRMDAEFFVKGSYAEHSTRAINNERLTIDNILGNP
ncbi:hypothetical protein QYE76_053552 [Lolium multiflorum]|uniref:Transposase (putative) gypsy type domain-containing protein n=1 Tax=Lolium multiflorum TaxID=4521 RepID=A0AAD8WM29_LOLMU|nr:hypothetical protein QYE76_053552 [Lolium multiflorum]